MSLLALARQRLAELSQRDVPMPCPNGTGGTNGTVGTEGTNDNATSRDAPSCPNGTSLRRVPTGHLPAEAAERIRAHRCPDGFSPDRWQRLQDGAARFAEEWGARATALGWTDAELFALAEPFARVDIQGAAWFIGASIVVAVTADAITLRTESGAMVRVYRRG